MSSAVYWRNASPAEKIELSAVPARTMVSGVHPVTLISSNITPVDSIANAKAHSVITKGLLPSTKADADPIMELPLPARMATAAPNAAALESPRVKGDARGLRSMLCITAPAIPSAAPASIAAATILKRSSHTAVAFQDPSGKNRYLRISE